LSELEARLSELETSNFDVINDAIEEFTENDTAESFILDPETRKSINK
jgi:hypothetical protein